MGGRLLEGPANYSVKQCLIILVVNQAIQTDANQEAGTEERKKS
jgi:hypothetical protein